MFISNSWEPLVVMGTVVSLISTIMLFWVIESPWYLYSCGEFEKCNEALRQIAKFNKVDNDVDFNVDTTPDTEEVIPNDNLSTSSSTSRRSADSWTLIRANLQNAKFVRNLFIMTIVWITVAFTFYLMGFYLSSMQGDINENALF